MTGSAIVALFGTMLLLAVVPGPTDFAVVARSVASGFNHGLLMVGGIIAADLLFIVIAVYSLSVVADRMGTAFVIVKYLCGAYLIWLGMSLLRARPEVAEFRGSMKSSLFSSFLGGLLMTLGDPKAILFYMGLFPAFLDLSAVSLTDTITIMLIATVVVGGVKLTYAYLADRARRFFDNSRMRKGLDIAAGTMLVGAGLYVVAR